MYELPTLDEIKQYAKENLDSLWEEYKGLESAEISSGPFNRLLEPQNEFIGKVRKDVKHLTETVNKEA